MAALDVYLEQRVVGSLTRPDSGRVRFEYSDAALDRFPDANLLSASLPVRADPYPNAMAKPFFEGLLPEGAIRQRVADELHVSYDNVHGLLERIGIECAGAVVIVPEDEIPPAADDAELEWLSSDEVADKIREMPLRPLGITPGRVRLSLAGVQDKLVLVRSPAGRFANPLYGAPSTHIVKPELGRYDGIVANEAFCLRVAACCRLAVARSEIARVGDFDCLVVERFDRTVGAGNRIERVHQEDLCQALGIPPSSKYESDGGPGVADIAAALRRLSTRPGADVVTFVRVVILNFLLGNSDAHAKNFALLYDPLTEARLAPFYDLVSTAVYDVEQAMAMSIGGEADPGSIDHDAWNRLAGTIGLSQVAFDRELADMAARAHRCAIAVRDQAVAEGWHHDVLDAIVDVVARRGAAVVAA